MLETFLQDARSATRLLIKSPLFAITAALSLAIGIGASTTIFSIANAMLIRPLPGLAEPERLVDLGRTSQRQAFDTVSYHYYRSVRERISTLSNVSARAGCLGTAGDADVLVRGPRGRIDRHNFAI